MSDNVSSISSPISLDSLRILDCLDREGSVSQASKVFNRAHSALLYSIAQLERNLGAKLIDRSGYRLRLTPFGKQVLKKGQEILALEAQLRALGDLQTAGWEAELRIIYDGLVDPTALLAAAMGVRRQNPEIVFSLYSEFLGGVESAFEAQNANAMISILPVQSKNVQTHPLPELRSLLVAHRDHPLAQGRKTYRDLQQFPFLVVRGSDERLAMSTEGLIGNSTVHVADFVTKKLGLLSQYGFGWMPEYLVQKEIKQKLLKPIRWERESIHIFKPCICSRKSVSGFQGISLFTKLYTEQLLRR